MRLRLFASLVLIGIGASAAHAQGFGVGAETLPKNGPQLGQEQVQRMRFGVTVTAQGGPCRGIAATAPIAMDWPEQQVKIESEDFSSSVKSVGCRMIGGTVKQMVVSMPFIAPGEECRAVVTLEITRHALVPPADTSVFVAPNPKKLKSDVRIYLAPSPLIESTHTKIRTIAKELTGGRASDKAAASSDEPKKTAWEKVETIYDWVRAHVEYKNGPIKGALQGLKDGYGDCEELTSLFIAICRASDIPARTVWVPGHCYPEFYLEDASGQGYWFPCQAAGNREFGGITEFRPILQKGDNFVVPERKDRQRYVAEHLTGSGGQPSVHFIREQL